MPYSTEFTHECLKEIFGLYNMQPDPPKTVVLEGHSMVSSCCLFVPGQF